MKIEDYIISVPDFPKPGILFRDVTGVLGNPARLCSLGNERIAHPQS